MDKYVKQDDGGVINPDRYGYLNAKKRKQERRRLENLYKTVENLQKRIETLENLNK